MKAAQHRRQFLPMVAPAIGVCNTNWAESWVALRMEMNISWPPEGLIMPAPLMSGDASMRPVDSKEAAQWLRKLLCGHKEMDPARRSAAHSLKSTILSWAAKRGLPADIRLQLGYHTSQFSMALVYSRDGASASLLAMQKLLEEVRLKKFEPDNTRSSKLHDPTIITAEDSRNVAALDARRCSGW